MSDELHKLRETIKRGKAMIEASKSLVATAEKVLDELTQTEKGQSDQTEEPPRSE